MNLTIPTVRLQRDRRPETERMTKRMARQARLAKSVRLPREAWLAIFANAVFQYRLSTLANLLLYQILNEAVQSVTILAGERREGPNISRGMYAAVGVFWTDTTPGIPEGTACSVRGALAALRRRFMKAR